ncbi:hypothetical protein ACET3Z_004980 [Daucus carota]
MGVLQFLKAKGFSEEMIHQEMQMDGFGAMLPSRDDFGLPVGDPVIGKGPTPNPFVDKMKEKVDSGGAPKMFDEKSKPDVVTPIPAEQVLVESPKSQIGRDHKSWSQAASPNPSPTPAQVTADPGVDPKNKAVGPAEVKDTTPVKELNTIVEDFSDNSVTPGSAFKNLKRIDECAQKGPSDPEFQLSKAQRKRLRRAQGKSTSPPPNL